MPFRGTSDFYSGSPGLSACGTKAELRIDEMFIKLDKFEVVILDDIGYVQQTREEMEVLFTFLAERYERKSLIITSNLLFSQWDQIFKNPMTAAAAIDRLVHHSTILEMIRAKSIRGDYHLETTGESGQSLSLPAPLPLRALEQQRYQPLKRRENIIVVT